MEDGKTIPPPPPSAPPPRGPRLRVVLLAGIIGLAMLTVGVIWGGPLKASLRSLADRFIARNAYSETTGQDGNAAAAPAGQKHFYTCGMHPWVILPKPGLCPICHMTLVPLDASKMTSEIAIDPVMSQNIGVRIAPVALGNVTQTIRTVGTVDYDETRVRDLNLKVSGWIQKLYVDYVGKAVHKGDPLFEIYSPDLYTAQEEYLQALHAGAGAGQTASAEGRKWDSDLLQSARQRLENYDISPDQIVALEKARHSDKTMTIRSPYNGLVIEKNVYEGMKADAGMQLFRLADLSKVWVMVTLYEYQIPYVQVGQTAEMSLSYIPGQAFEGKVAYIYPYLNKESRQVKVRLEFDNPNELLKPGMFANVELHSTLAKDRVLVPREAIIDTGERQVAFVSLGEGRFQPRLVKLGVEAQSGMVEVLDGLKAGEMIVVSGQFLLDSESRYREALAKMVEGQLAATQPAPSVVAPSENQQAQLPPPAQQALNGLLDAYFQIGQKLSSDTIEGIPDSARTIAKEVDAMIAMAIPADPQFWGGHSEMASIRGEALALVDAKDIGQARQHFADLGIGLSKFLHAVGIPPSYGKTVEELHCPMYREGQGGTNWLQVAGEVRNPYYGQMMLGCFDKRTTIPVSGQAATVPSSDRE